MAFIVVAGTPGTGKTVLGSRLARFLQCRFTTLSWLVFEKGLWIDYDRERRSFIIDYDGVLKALNDLASSRCFILDTHWLEPLAEVARKPDLVIVLRTNPLILLERLKRRGWPWRKVVENVEAELVGVIASEAQSLFANRVVEIDTSSGGVERALKEALEFVQGVRRRRCCLDWLSVLSDEEVSMLTRLLGSEG